MTLILLLLAPLAEAAVCSLLRSRLWMERVSVVSAAINLVLAGVLVRNVARFESVSAFGGFLYSDALSALVVMLTALVCFVCAIYAVGYFRTDLENQSITLKRLKEYYILTPLFVFALFLVALANNLGIMWVAIEGSTLASVLLIAFYNEKTSLEAAWKYIIIGSIGISMALFGTLLTYYAATHVVGTESIEGLNWTRLMAAAPSLNPKALRLGFIFILMGYGTKAGIAPMHTWKPDSYSQAPVPSAAILAAAVLNCALYGILRFHILTSKCLGPGFSGNLLLWFGLGSLLIATPFILVQTNFRRLLAYSSIDHTGIMLVGFGVGGSLGPFGALLHMFYHALAKPLLFFCAGNVQQQFGTAVLRKVGGGVIHLMPVTGVLFLAGTLAVTGVPPAGLFQSELTVLSASVQGRSLWVAGLLVGCVVTIFSGFLYHIGQLVLGAPRTVASPTTESWWRLSPMLLIAVLTLLLGFWLPAPLLQLIQGAGRIVTASP
ncbi:MAG: proton-conducting transporter membrane subunit [Acidobacteriota bacterium]